MAHVRIPRALLPLAAFVLLAAPAKAGSFAPTWTLTGWVLLQDAGNTDGDPQHELLFASKADGHMALVDGLSGAVEKEFPEFTSTNTLFTTQNVDGDAVPELFLCRPANGPVTSLTAAYDWNGASYVPLFAHTDPVANAGPVRLRGATTWDMLEISETDVRVRSLAGTILLQASTAIPGWSGTGVTATLVDIDGDGLEELGIIEQFFSAATKTHLFDHAAGFAPAWSVTGWIPASAANTDGDAQPELVLVSGADGHYALFDGLSGAMEQDFPEFKGSENANLAVIDGDGDGIAEVYLKRPNFGTTTRLFSAYEWNGASYGLVFSHTDPLTDFSLVPLRGSSQLDLLERNDVQQGLGGDVRVRTLSGALLFRASTEIPGWSGYDTRTAEVDADQDGILELAIQDAGTLRFVRHAGTFVEAWSTPAWTLVGELTNLDVDPSSELVVASTSDEHYALLDTPTGAVEHEFPFAWNNSYLLTFDLDADSRLELFFGKFTPPLLNTAYDWTPSGWETQFSHGDELEGTGHGHFRNPGLNEIVELGPADLRVRDGDGLVIFRASTDLPGWTGMSRDMAGIDVNDDGVSELLAIDDVAVRMLHPIGLTSVAPGGDGRGLALLGCAPNPFRQGTAIRFTTASAGEVGIRVLDAGGRLIRRLGDHLPAGLHEVRWDGRDEHGRAVPSGLWFYEITVDGIRKSGRMVRLGD